MSDTLNAAPPSCLWCFGTVARSGDTCNEECYTNLCGTFARGILYLREGDEPPKDLYRQPWHLPQGNEDDIPCTD